jgi:transposase
MELCMSQKERDRLRFVNMCEKGLMKQKEAARLSGVGDRQMRRIVARYRKEGDAGLVHRSRGRKSNRKMRESFKKQVISLLADKYKGFGPTLAGECLEREEKLKVSRETLRAWMMPEGLWKSRRQRVKHQQWRPRKQYYGEMVQLDTSVHDWFEGRGEEAVLISMIDDATSRVLKRFTPCDGTMANMRVLEEYIRRHGRPVAIYADRASHFLTTRQPSIEEALAGEQARTQIKRALEELGIQYIAAYSPQAKGRVERSFQTDQDRLVKSMRLEGISSIAQANAHLDRVYMPLWHKRFTVPPTSLIDAHRPADGYDLKAILSVQNHRVVANDYTVRHNNRLYQIDRKEAIGGLRGSKVIVEERLDGSLKIRWRGRYLRYRQLPQTALRLKKAESAVTPVGLRPPSVTALSQPWRPSPDHPWNRTFLSCTKQDISTLR